MGGSVPTSRRLIVGLTGASGVLYGIRLLEVLRESAVEAHLVVSEAARTVIALETGLDPEAVESLAYASYREDALAAPPASGTFLSLGMVVVPCSIKTLSAIAQSRCDNLLTRAADVVLKERRKLVLVVRETPLHLGHLRLMTRVTRDHGAVILPPVPGFYHQPKTIQDLVDHTVGKILDQFGIEHCLYPRWQGYGQWDVEE